MDYKSADYFIYEQLVQLENAILPLEIEGTISEDIKKYKEKIVNKSYRVAVVGEFKRGKSSLINALLGSEILPADITPTTATVNRITYGIKPKITVNYKDGKSEIIGMNELSEYVTKLTKEGEARARTIKETVIEYPTSICRNYVDIIDTPGLNDNEEMTAVTLALLKNIDAAIVAISAKSPFSGLEKNYICDMIMNNDIYDMVFAVTFIDAFTEDETKRLIAYISNGLKKDVFAELKNRKAGFSIIKKAHRILDEPKICGVSSFYALESDKIHDLDMRKKSGIDEFTRLINDAFNTGQSQSIRDGAIDFIEKSAEQINEFHENRLKSSEIDAETFAELSNLFFGTDKKFCLKIDNLFSGISNNLLEKLKESYALKNDLARAFVKELSEFVRDNTNEEIREIIERVYSDQEATVNGWFSENVVPQVNTLLNDAFDQAVLCFKELFNSELKKINKESQYSKKILAAVFALRLSEFSDNKENNYVISINESMDMIKKICFNFINREFINEDLTDRNIIEDILESIDKSFGVYIDKINKAVSDIRDFWKRKGGNSLQSLYLSVKEIDRGKIIITEEERMEYIIKYENSAEVMRKIVENIRTIKN